MRAKHNEIGPPLLGLPDDDIGNAMSQGFYQHRIGPDAALAHFRLGCREYLLAAFAQCVQELVGYEGGAYTGDSAVMSSRFVPKAGRARTPWMQTEQTRPLAANVASINRDLKICR